MAPFANYCYKQAVKPIEGMEMATEFGYQAGFGNTFTTEAEPGALPKVLNNPQRAPYGLYAEQLTGTSLSGPKRRESTELAVSYAALGEARKVRKN